jgi:tRNA threonylcarbamoyl adenosine modification protein (Sua5/YciO/YrdC/YwlC family)
MNRVARTDELTTIASVLLEGGVVLLPTDTVYGFHALASDDDAVGRIASIKGRDDTKPFIVLGSSLQQLETLGIRISDEIRGFLLELWPGPLTAVVPLAEPIAASRGSRTLAVRIPDLPWLRQLLELTGPLASTSANRSGEPPLESPELLSHDLHAALDAVVSAGPLIGEPSTVVDFTGDEPRFIREGERLFTQKVWKTLRKSL